LGFKPFASPYLRRCLQELSESMLMSQVVDRFVFNGHIDRLRTDHQ